MDAGRECVVGGMSIRSCRCPGVMNVPYFCMKATRKCQNTNLVAQIYLFGNEWDLRLVLDFAHRKVGL